MHRIAKSILLLPFLFDAVFAAHSLSLDLRLIQMVPPESQVIASMLSPKPGGQPGSLLLLTGNNKVDFEDFFAVTGADASRRIHEVVLVAAGAGDGALSEHSLLVSGHFNRDAIYRFTESGNARLESYRGQAVLMVPPLMRERNSFKQLRWLAILNSDIAIFGTPESVQQELDRQIAKTRPDPTLMKRLSRLGPRDESWCLSPSPAADGITASFLNKLDPRLGAIASEGGSIQYGVHFGRLIEITASSNTAAKEGSNSETPQSAAHSRPGHYLLADSPGDGDEGTTAIVKVSRRRYDEWLNEFSKGNPASGATLPH